MSKYYFYNGRLYTEDELRHAMPKASPLKGIEKENHKYIKREWKNNRWVYTYPDDDAGNKPVAKNIQSLAQNRKVAPESKPAFKVANVLNLGKTALSNIMANTSRKASSEYDAEVEYNSKPNVYPGKTADKNQNEKLNNKSDNKTKTNDKSKTDTKKASSEYEAEVEYNSQKNVYPEQVIEEKVLKEDVIEEKVLKEDVIEEKVITEKDQLNTDKKRDNNSKNWLASIMDGIDDAIEWVNDRMDEVVDNFNEAAEKFAKDSADWANNLFENYQTEYVKAKKQSDEALKQWDAALTEYKRAKDANTKAKLYYGVSNEDKDKANEAYEAAAKALEEAEKAAYEARRKYLDAKDNPLRRIDDWLSDVTNEQKPVESKVESDDDFLDQLDRKETDLRPEDDLFHTNPNGWIPTVDSNIEDMYDDNCGVCTLTYDMRRRGYDVEAGSDAVTMSDGYAGLTLDEIASFYKDCSRSDFVYDSDLRKEYGPSRDMSSQLKYLEIAFEKYGEGARGNLCVFWNGGGGHSMVIEVENGKLVVRDAQNNETYNIYQLARYIDSFCYLRTDNLELSEEVLKYVHNRKENKR